LGIVAVAVHITDNNGMPMIRSVPAQESRGDTGRIDVSVVTPSFNMLNYLQRCCASVADQEYVTHEHIVVDGGSTDETPEWLSCQASLISQSQRDNGMYDAVNRGFRLARGEIVSHLNCDEQLLPDTLHFVRRFFREHPEVDVLFGDVLAVRPDGGLIAYRPIERAIVRSNQ
jgi:glycosyltransferase involved in cell wall biosynthesis